MRPLVLIAAACLLATSCTTHPPQAARPVPANTALPSPLGTPPASAVVEAGCGSTPLFKGQIPDWLEAAGGHNNPAFLPYAVSTPALAAGFLFAHPLRAGQPENPANKILWVVGLPRSNSALEILAHPLGANAPIVHVSQPADSGPGEIYPSIVDVPKPGCWHLDLAWAGHRTALDLLYT